MNNPTQHPEQKNTAASDKLSTKRRAFIKGSAAALPVVLTLRNGSAFAADSISCYVKQAGITPQTITPAVDTDSFIRAETKVRTISTGLDLSNGIMIYQDPTGVDKWFPTTTNSSSDQYYVTYGTAPDAKMVLVNTDPTKDETIKYNFNAANDTQGFILAILNPANGRPYNPPIVGPKNTNQGIVTTQSCLSSLAFPITT
jgi:hypothetical protein